MKVEVIEKEVGYPKLQKINSGSGMIVLFMNETTGTVVVPGINNSTFVLGEHYTKFGVDRFEDFTGEVILRN